MNKKRLLPILAIALLTLCSATVRAQVTAVDPMAPADTIAVPDTATFVDGRYCNRVCPEARTRQPKSGILIIGSGPDIRVVSTFTGNPEGGTAYTDAVNKYRQRLGDNVRIYSMILPIASAYYTPDDALQYTRDQKATIDGMYGRMPGVTGVDAFTALAWHVREPIYLRTDHHWAPLGAYYAAEAFAKAAGVPFRDLSNYDKKTVHNFLGTMYTVYTKDAAVGRAPEEFEYYVPRDVEYHTTAITYSLGKNRAVTGQDGPKEVNFFREYKDGSHAAYCTFMGGDSNTTKVETSTKNGRRLLIIKDSYGNALPGYLFYSFEEIHVIDFRYYPGNVVNYINNNGITDLLFAHCISLAYTAKTGQGIQRMIKD